MALLRRTTEGHHVFFCPACKCGHQLDGRWTISGTPERPSAHPSYLTRSGHYVPGRANPDDCWCTWNKEHPKDPAPFKCSVCHLFVTDGQLVYQGDCTHELVGKTVPMVDF